MDQEAAESQLLPGSEPLQQVDEGQSSEKDCPQTEKASEEAPAPLDGTKEKPVLTPQPVEDVPAEAEEEVSMAGCEPPVDWFEPLEDDDANSIDRNDPEDESLAGESEMGESVAGSEKTMRRAYRLQIPRRQRRSNRDEGWIVWPVLGEGWKRKEVVRRSGSSIGQKDVYYLSPAGDRVRSRVELTTVLQGHLDLTNFEYKSGKFYEGEAPPVRVRARAKRKPRERSSSESSWLERGEGAETPDSHHRLTPNIMSKNLYVNQMSFSLNTSVGNLKQSSRYDDMSEDKIRLPFPSSSRPLPSINGEIGSEDSILVCAKCGISFTGTWYDKQRKRPSCPTCWASKTKEHPMIRFRKWIPCGQCVGCHNTINCGQCANCKHGLQSPESRKRVCRKRRCICPIRKNPGGGGLLLQRPQHDLHESFDDSFSFQNEVKDSQQTSLKGSDGENFSVNVDLEDEDLSTDDDDDWHKKRKRRSCGECKACLSRKDCGTCDFCVDKPKFGGSNKKRQKCRLRQCQRQAMRHLLPFQMGLSEYGSEEGPALPGRPRPHYTYSRKSSLKKRKGLESGLDLDTDNEDEEDSNLQPSTWSKHSFDVRDHQSSTQPLDPLDFGDKNGLTNLVPHIRNHDYSKQNRQSQWGVESSYTGRDGQTQVEEEDEDEEEDEEEEEEEKELPMITQIYSLADTPSGSGSDMDNQLMKLLHSLRSSVLPILWYAIMVDGPQLQLIQCSKQSAMADTIVLIDPGFCYQVTVQKQPLLPTHSLYDRYPAPLTSVTEVVSLLLALEKFVVCHGIPLREPLLYKGSLVLERASTCDFLVKKNESVCSNCRTLQRP